MFAIDRAGLVGADGETHHGIYDISFMRILPRIILMTPSNERELLLMLNTGLNHKGPSAVRYPRGNTACTDIVLTEESLPIGKSRLIQKGQKLAILVFGQLLNEVIDISKELSLTLIDMRFVKPIDEERIDELSSTHQHLITIEDNVIAGGAGSSINEYLVEKGYEITITNIGIPDKIISHGSQDELYSEVGLDKKSLEYRINEIYNHISSNKKIVE